MEDSLKTNFHGPLNITRAIMPKLRAKGTGTLLYVSSQAAWHSDPSAACYCAAKFALEGMFFLSLHGCRGPPVLHGGMEYAPSFFLFLKSP